MRLGVCTVKNMATREKCPEAMRAKRARLGECVLATAILSGACGSNGAATSSVDASPVDTTDAKASEASASDGAVAGEGGSYADPSMWLCGAGAPHDYCLDPQTATM